MSSNTHTGVRPGSRGQCGGRPAPWSCMLVQAAGHRAQGAHVAAHPLSAFCVEHPWGALLREGSPLLPDCAQIPTRSPAPSLELAMALVFVE